MFNISIENKIFFSKYKPDKKIGEGSFGKIYLAHNIATNEKYAIKLENRNNSQSLLEQEAYLLCYLKGDGIPQVRSFGYSGEYNVLIMELLGKSLEVLFQENRCKFTLKTVCMLGIQMISRLQFIHSKYILHRDIKPDNFTIGTDNNSKNVYLIDFGLAKKFGSSRTKEHIKYKESKKMTGTARYASIRALKGCEQGRRDDMESVGYVLMYFLRGSLPWQGLKVNKREDRYEKIYEKKKNTTEKELCFGYPDELSQYIKYTRGMEFEQEPDYLYLKGLFEKIMNDNGYEFDYGYDWVTNSKGHNEKLIIKSQQINEHPIKVVKQNKKERNLQNDKCIKLESKIKNNSHEILGKQENILMNNIMEKEKNIIEPKTFTKQTKERLHTTLDISNNNTTITNYAAEGRQIKQSNYKFLQNIYKQNKNKKDEVEVRYEEDDDNEIIENEYDGFDSQEDGNENNVVSKDSCLII